MGIAKSNYGAMLNDYSGTNGQVGSSVTYGGHHVDTSPASAGNSTSTILAEVCKVIPSPVANGYYSGHVDLPRGNVGYCAYYVYWSCGGIPVPFAFFGNPDG